MSVTHILVDTHAITTAQSLATRGKETNVPADATGLTVEVNLVVGGGGTAVKVYIQTTLDGTNYIDIMAFALATSSVREVMAINERAAILTDYVVVALGTLSDDTAIDGILGKKIRAQVVTTGTYTGTTTVTVIAKVKIK